MPSETELRTQLEKLRAARASGVLVVRHGDQQVTYRSVAEIQAAIDAILKELRRLKGGRRPRYARQQGRGF